MKVEEMRLATHVITDEPGGWLENCGSEEQMQKMDDEYTTYRIIRKSDEPTDNVCDIIVYRPGAYLELDRIRGFAGSQEAFAVCEVLKSESWVITEV